MQSNLTQEQMEDFLEGPIMAKALSAGGQPVLVKTESGESPKDDRYQGWCSTPTATPQA